MEMDASIEIVLDDEINEAGMFPVSTSLTIEDEFYFEDEKSNKDSSNQMQCCYKLVNSVHEFEGFLRRHEIETYFKYNIYKTNGLFNGKGKEPVGKPRIHWGALSKVSGSLSTTPYLIVGTRYYVCHLGKCYYSAKLQKNCKSNNGTKKRYKKVTDSKKVGCPATFKVQRLIIFPDNKVSSDNPSEKARMGVYIKKNLSRVRMEQMYLFKLPDVEDHKRHDEERVMPEREPLDKAVVNKIKKLVHEGQTDISQISELLAEFVETEIKVNDKKRRRFYPSRVDIQRIIHFTKWRLRKSKIDHGKAKLFVDSFDNTDEIFFQCLNIEPQKTEAQSVKDSISNDLSRKSGFIFVYQNREMRRLYELYGRDCILLDPTYRFCKYSIPFYSLVVQTNVSYQVVAIFMAEFEIKEFIVEVLRILVQWNPSVIPKYCLADNNSEEQRALETVFPDIKVFIAAYYCHSSWNQRFMMKDMEDVDQHEAFAKLNAVIDAPSEQSVRSAVNEFKTYHSNSNLREYFEKNWQREIKRWVCFYRPSDMIFESNEAVDRLDDELRYLPLSRSKEYLLSEMICYICRVFIPESLNNYRLLNESILYRKLPLNRHIPLFLMESPQWIVDVVMERIVLADESLSCSYVEFLGGGVFSLFSKKANAKYKVKFDVIEKTLLCNCSVFIKRKLLCEHPIIIGRFYPLWNLEKISSWLFDKPIYKYDERSKNIKSIGNQDLEITHPIIDFCSSPSIEITSSSMEPDKVTDQCSTLMNDCLHYLVSMETMTQFMNVSELGLFRKDLECLRSKWESFVQKGDNASSNFKEDLPLPMLKRISQRFGDAKS